MDAAALSRIATIIAQVEGEERRCSPCWMGAHVSCNRGDCTCSEEFHNNDGPVREHRPVKERGALSTAKAG